MCTACRAYYHLECWTYNGERCAIFGCAKTPAPAVTAPAPPALPSTPITNPCWFCNSRPAVQSASREVQMHRVLERTEQYVVIGIRHKVQFQKTTVRIPRCTHCENAQPKLERFGCLTCLGIAALILVPVWASEMQDAWKVVLSVAVMYAAYKADGFVTRLYSPSGVRTAQDIPTNPVVKLYSDDGWEIGDEPSAQGDRVSRDEAISRSRLSAIPSPPQPHSGASVGAGDPSLKIAERNAHQIMWMTDRMYAALTPGRPQLLTDARARVDVGSSSAQYGLLLYFMALNTMARLIRDPKYWNEPGYVTTLRFVSSRLALDVSSLSTQRQLVDADLAHLRECLMEFNRQVAQGNLKNPAVQLNAWVRQRTGIQDGHAVLGGESWDVFTRSMSKAVHDGLFSIPEGSKS